MSAESVGDFIFLSEKPICGPSSIDQTLLSGLGLGVELQSWKLFTAIQLLISLFYLSAFIYRYLFIEIKDYSCNSSC